jgi:alpha-tubulin suppressor-like RCC1 family protein
MEKMFFTMSIFLSFFSIEAQPSFPATTPKYIMGLGEYQCFIINTSTGKLYGISNNLGTLGLNWDAGIAGLPIQVGGVEDRSFRDVASGMHNSLAVDDHGDVWTWGSNGVGESGMGSVADQGLTPVRIVSDSLGNPFTDVVQVVCWSTDACNGNLALKSDGTVWIWGLTREGLRGNGQSGQVNTRPVQVNIPGHRKIVKVVAGMIVVALASDGTVWTWGGNNRKELLGTNSNDYMHPHQVPLPQRAKDIAGGSYFSYALGLNGVLYGWGYYTAYMCIGTQGWAHQVPPPVVPRDLTKDLNLPHPVVSIVANSVSTHVILSDGTLWGWGDNSSGCVGNGQELDFMNHKPPYAWDWGPGQLLVQKPVHLARGVNNFMRIFGGTSAVFYSYAETATGQLYSWGRNKGSVLGNGVVGATPDILSVYPNSWDVTTVTAVDPFALKADTVVTSPYCLLHPDSSPCNQYQLKPKASD